MIASPCIQLCRLDEHRGWCAGCLRTTAEIAAWPQLDDAGRQAVLQAVAERRRKLVPPAPENVPDGRH